MAIEKDPVCGMEATNSKITSDHEGKTYYFCSEGCKDTFEREPDKYAEKKSEEK